MGKKRINYKIRAKNVDLPYRGRIPIGADNYKNRSDIGDQRFSIGHEFYNEDLCEIKHLDRAPLRKILDCYKKLCKCTSVQDFDQTGIRIKNIENANHYREYYKGLTNRMPDIEIKEFYAGERERAFFFIDPAKKIIQIIALRNGHTETKKVKR